MCLCLGVPLCPSVMRLCPSVFVRGWHGVTGRGTVMRVCVRACISACVHECISACVHKCVSMQWNKTSCLARRRGSGRLSAAAATAASRTGLPRPVRRSGHSSGRRRRCRRRRAAVDARCRSGGSALHRDGRAWRKGRAMRRVTADYHRVIRP